MKTTVTLVFESEHSIAQTIKECLVASIEKDFLEEGETCALESLQEFTYE